MPSPIEHLDELIDRAAKQAAEHRKQKTALEERIRELEAELAEVQEGQAQAGAERIAELEKTVARYESERDETRERVERAAGRLRKLLDEADPSQEENA